MGFLCFKSKADMSKAFGCLPLAIFCIGFCALQIALAGYQLYSTIEATNDEYSSRIIGFIYAGVQLFLGVFSLLSIVFRWAPGVGFMKLVVMFIMVSWVLGVIVRWVIWINNINGIWTTDGNPWVPQPVDYVNMVILTLVAVLFCVGGWYVNSCFVSLARIIDVGGTGFEGLSYKEVTTGVQFQPDDDDDDSV